MRELVFRLSIDAAAHAPNASIYGPHEHDDMANWTQTVPYAGVRQRTVDRTDWRFAAGAMAAALLGVLGALPLFWGWWQLGRAVSLNPLELAKAFRAPLLAGVAHSNADRAELAGPVGLRRVRYGAVTAAVLEDVEGALLSPWQPLPSADGDMAMAEAKLVLCFDLARGDGGLGRQQQGRRFVATPVSGASYG
jgi:hypothetical protein